LGGLAETAARVVGSGLRFLPGVELSARLNGQLVHLLGYGIDPAEPQLVSFVMANGARLHRGSDDAVRLLAEVGYPISLDDYASYTWDRSRGGWKALNFLIDRGFCRDVHSYFSELFGDGIRHPEPDYPSPEHAIAAVQRAGGLVVLAHPGASFSSSVDAASLDELVEMGIAGVECYSFHHDERTTHHLVEYCLRSDLLITGGSDCHGGFAGRALGVPQVCANDLRLGDLWDRMLT
jgi:predicted metal-dependent phosphoesterase TrpH